jgi:hypothetical protein
MAALKESGEPILRRRRSVCHRRWHAKIRFRTGAASGEYLKTGVYLGGPFPHPDNSEMVGFDWIGWQPTC